MCLGSLFIVVKKSIGIYSKIIIYYSNCKLKINNFDVNNENLDTFI